MSDTITNISRDDFLANRLVLHCPNRAEIAAAYDTLPAAGMVEITCPFADLTPVMAALQESGFFGMMLNCGHGFSQGIQMVAFKGKDNPCYDTGKTACYHGSAFAVLDDDHHLLTGTATRICEKTAVIYKLPVYGRFVEVSRGDSELSSRLQTDPEPFDCDSFETDVLGLAERLPRSLSDSVSEDNISLIYPGPFRILILTDGCMIPRAVPVRVPPASAQALLKEDGCIELEETMAKPVVHPVNFMTQYQELGVQALLQEPVYRVPGPQRSLVGFGILDRTPDSMRQRVLKLIETKSDYFLLTGSDSRDIDGCCPSDDVTAANLLAEAGLLQAARTAANPDACPVTLYAFAGEIDMSDNRPQIQINDSFRAEIEAQIRKRMHLKRPVWSIMLRWSLLLFVCISLLWFGMNIFRDLTGAGMGGFNFVDELDLPFRNGVAVLHFHRTLRCRFCDDMERHTRAALDLYFAEEQQNGTLTFRAVDMEVPRYQVLQKRYDLFTSTVVLVKLEDGHEKRWQTVTAAWSLTNDRDKFLEMFKSTLAEFKQGSR